MTLTVGTLVHDGEATPHQIALRVPITAADSDTTCAMRYRQKNTASPAALGQEGAYVTGHNLYRTNSTGAPVDCFAWTIMGLKPNTPYEVEVTLDNAADAPQVQTVTFTTRKLPPRAGKPTVTATTSDNLQTKIDSLSAGSVLELAAGSYSLSGITINANGSEASPIYIRGATREGVILTDTTGAVLAVQDSDWLIIENLSIVGSGSDSGTAASSIGIYLSSAHTQSFITVRNVTMSGIDQAVISGDHDVTGILVYDCIGVGNNLWNASFVDTNITWNDCGLQLSGDGNSAWNCTLKGFGDTIAVTYSGASSTKNCHYHNLDIRNSCDDLIEVDEAVRNVTFYDNRSHNSMTFSSLDPLYGGPFIACRNIAVNVGRQTQKWNTSGSGQFLYNNTIVVTSHTVQVESGWYNSGDGGGNAQQSWGYQNNLLVYRGSGRTTYISFVDNNPIDLTNNAWYPNNQFTLNDVAYSNLADIQANIGNSTPIFSAATKAHTNDVITVSNPWTATVTLGANYLTEVTATYTPTLSGGDAAKNAGVAIAGVTDGFAGAAPDIGAIIAGRAVPIYGNNLPQWVKDLDVGDWYQIPNTALSSVAPSPTPVGNTGPISKIEAWTSFVVDQRSGKVYSVANGGHGDYAGNEVDELTLDVETPAWAEILKSTVNGDIPAGQTDYYNDGRPASRHTYYGATWNELDDRFMFFSGSFWDNGGFLPQTDSYNIGANSYNAGDTHPDTSPSVAVAAVTYDSHTGNAYIMEDILRRFNRAANTFTTLSPLTNEPGNGWNVASAFDSKRRRFLFAGTALGPSLLKHVYDVDAGTFTQINYSGAEASNISDTENAMVYVSSLDAYLYKLNGSSGGTVYKIDASTWAVTSMTTSGGAGIAAATHLFNKFLYVERLGGCVIVPDYNASVWFLKTNDAQPATPEDGGGSESPVTTRILSMVEA